MTTANNSNGLLNSVVFLAINDGEAAEIFNVCREAGVEVIGKKLPWGVSVSDFSEEIAAAVSAGKTPVLVEMVEDQPVPEGAIIVDHHNDRADRPAALLQVLDLLGLEPSRRQQLIAANDAAYIPGMEMLGASDQEVREIRAFDRKHQLVWNKEKTQVFNKFTPEVEAEAARAINDREVINGVTVVRMGHSATAAVTDALYSRETEQNILCLCGDGESDYFGNGKLCRLLQGNKTGKTAEGWDTFDHFGGWTGGGEDFGFWGGYADQQAILDYVVNYFAK